MDLHDLLLSPQFRTFVVASAILAAVASVAAHTQRRALAQLEWRLQAFAQGKEAGTAPKGPGPWRNARFYWLLGGSAAALLIYAVLGPLIGGFASPYLASLAPTGGPWIQATIGIGLWAPAIALSVAGLLDAHEFARGLSQGLAALGSRKSPPAGLFTHHYKWFFHRFQVGLLLWGLVGGLAVFLVMFARPEAGLRLAAASAVCLVVVWLLGCPLVQTARHLAHLSKTWGEEATATLAALHQQATTPGPASQLECVSHEAQRLALHDALQVMVPTSPAIILRQNVPLAVFGLVGPFAAQVISLAERLLGSR